MLDWWQGAVIYQIYPRSFQDTNNDGIGDLPGILERFEHIVELGVDAIWISPFYKSPMRDFGYDVADFCDVDPIFGSLDDFDKIVAKAHENGIKVIIDQVYSHTSCAHSWFSESRQNRTNPKADWYIWSDPKEDGTPPNNWQSLFGGAAWTWDARRRQYYLHNFLADQPDLNIHNHEVQDAVLDAAKFWLDRGVDGFRFDAANFYMHDTSLRDNPPRTGHKGARTYEYQRHLYNRSQPENFQFIKRLRALLDQYDARFSVAEIGDRYSIKEVIDYCKDDDRLHTAYSFVFIENHDISPKFLQKAIEDWRDNANGAQPAWTFSNHDAIRAPSRWGHGDNPKFAALLNAILLSLNGTICLYQGEELGLPQADIPYDALQDPEAIANWPETLGRDGSRTPVPWDDKQKNAGFSDHNPWLPIDERHLSYAVSAQIAEEQSLLNLTKQLIELRHQYEALRFGDIEFIDVNDKLAVFKRFYKGQSILCIFNLSAQPCTLPSSLLSDKDILFTLGESKNDEKFLQAFGGIIAK